MEERKNNKKVEYDNIKRKCCDEQKEKWNAIVDSGGNLEAVKMEMFDYYTELRQTLLEVPDDEYVSREMSNMFEKMVELAEYKGGSNLGTHYFQVRRGINPEAPTAFMMAVMGPGEVARNSLIGESYLPSSLNKVQLLYFGKDVTGILNETCRDMLKLKNVYFNVDSSCLSIGNSAFENTSLEEIVIPDSVKTLDYGCFAYCEYMKKITIGKNVTEIWHNAFYNCAKLKEIYIPDSVKLLGDQCFRMNTEMGYEGGIVKISGMKGVEKIGEQAFDGTEIVDFTGGPNLKSIGGMCFIGTPLESLTLYWNDELEIGSGAFENLDYLEVVNLVGGNSKKWVGKLKGQFFNCYLIDNLAVAYGDQIKVIRERNGYDESVDDAVIYIAYARILEQEAAQLLKGGGTKVQIPSDISRFIATGFSPATSLF